MPYGNDSPLLGSTINPALFLHDYSQYQRADASRMAQTAGLIDAMSNAASTFADYKKQQTDQKSALKASVAEIDAASTLFPEMRPMLEGLGAQIKNEELPLSDRAAIASRISSVIGMGVDQMRYGSEMGLKRDQMDLARQDQANQNKESSMRQWAFGNEISAAERQQKAQQLDDKTKATLGPALLQHALSLAPKGVGESIGQNIGSYAPDEQFQLASSVMSLIPKSQQTKAPTVIDVGVPGGTQKMQWDGGSGQWIPVQTAIQPSPGSLSPDSLPEGLKPYASEFINAGAKYGVDPKVLAAISMHETGNGTSSAFKNKNNAMGVSNANGPIDTGTVGASIDQMARLLAAGMKGQGPYAGKSTIAEIAGTYAPVGAGNDPRGLNSSWASGVSSALKKIGGDPAAPIGFTPDKSQELSPTEKIAEQKYEDEKNAAKAKESSAIAEAQSFVNTLDELEKHPGFENLFGSNIGVPTWWPGSAGADAKAILGKVQGKAFLEAIQKMKGMGALSEKEGETATKAYSALTTSMSEEAARKEIVTLRSILEKGIAAAPAETPQVDPFQAAAERLRAIPKQ